MKAVLRASAIKVGYLKSMLHMRHYMQTERPDSAAMRFGRLVHMAVLEPDKHPYVWHGKKKLGADYDKWLADVPPFGEICTPEEWEDAVACAASVMANEQAADLLAGKEKERKIYLEDSEVGPVSARIDAIGGGQIVELKTTGRIDARSIERTCANMAYHIQLGFYKWIAAATGLDKYKSSDCYIIAVESDAPFDCAIYKLSAFDVSAGLVEAIKVCEQYRACERSGVFPGIQTKQEEIKLAEWAYKDTGAPAGIEDGDLGDL